jgi:hypothetical protein
MGHRMDPWVRFFPLGYECILVGNEIFFCRNDQNGSVSDFFEFDWIRTKTQKQKLQLNNGQTVHLIVYIISSF